MTLALEYRPHRFDQIVGQRAARVVLSQMALKKDLPPALLFTGPRGTGKTTSGRILAAALNAPDGKGDVDLDSVHARDIFNGNSPDVLEIDAASNGNVDDVRNLKQQIIYATSGEFRIVLLDEAHSMSREAFNALLKTLEEPPERTLFALLTTEPNRILPTVVSRCMSIEFRKVANADVRNRLRFICNSESISAEDSLLAAIARRADGGMRDAVMLLDQASRVGIRTGDQLAKLLGEVDFAPELWTVCMAGNMAAAFQLAEAQVDRAGDPTTVIDGMVNCARDVFVLKAGAEGDMDGEPLAVRKALAGAIEDAKLARAMRVLWDYRTRVRGGDLSAGMVLALGMVCEVFSAGTRKPIAEVATGPLSLAQMRSMK